MKKQVFIPFGAVGLGAVGAVLKYIQNKSSYDDKGLIPHGDPVTAVMTAITVIFCIAALLISRKIAKPGKDTRSYPEAFPIGKLEALGIEAASAVIVIASFMVQEGTVVLAGRAVNFTAILGVCAGVCCGLLALTAALGRKGQEQCLFSSVPALFFCYLMAMVYKGYAGKPIISQYCYECMALGSAAVSFYFGAGHTFGRGNAFGNVLSQTLSVYFLVIAIPGYTDKWLMVISAACAVMMISSLSAYLRGQDAQTEADALVENDENKDSK